MNDKDIADVRAALLNAKEAYNFIAAFGAQATLPGYSAQLAEIDRLIGVTKPTKKVKQTVEV